jgi:cell division protein FtsQ
MSVTAPADRRFRRSQIHATRRRRLRVRPAWRALRTIGLLAILVMGGYWAAGAAVGVPWLKVRHIHVHGNQRVHESEIAALLDGLTGESLLSADLERWRLRLFASAWVADAKLRRRLPATIDVEIRERVPMGIARAGSDLFLMDAAGTVIDEYGPRYSDCDLPIIDGLVPRPAARPLTIDRARGQFVSRLMAELRTRPELARRVSQIDVRNLHDAHVILDGDPAVVRLGDSRFVERLESYVGLQATLREQVPDIDYVDVRFGQRVYVGLAPGSTAAPGQGHVTLPARGPGARTQR